MREPIIYKITNLKNGKVYIGQTIQGIARRKAEHVHHKGYKVKARLNDYPEREYTQAGGSASYLASLVR